MICLWFVYVFVGWGLRFVYDLLMDLGGGAHALFMVCLWLYGDGVYYLCMVCLWFGGGCYDLFMVCLWFLGGCLCFLMVCLWFLRTRNHKQIIYKS